MKISKILAGMSAMALAASMMTMGASAEISNANFNNGKDYCFDVFTAVGAEKAATISSVRAKLSFKSIDDLKANGAGGGFITSSDGNNWKSTDFGNDGAGKPITFVVDEASSTATMEKTLTDADKFTGKGEDAMSYAQVVFQSWWGEFSVDNVACYDAAGELVCSVTGDGIDLYKAPEKGGNEVDLSEYKKQTEVTLNGEGRSVSDSGKVRINIKHPWVDDATFNLADDWSAFAGADAIAVTVDISNVTDAFNAYPCFTNGIADGIGYWEASDNNPAVTVNADGTYTFIVKFPSALEMDAKNMFFAINTDLAGTDGEDPAVKMAVKKVVVLNKSDEKPTDSTEPTDSTDSTDSDESKANPTDSVDSKTNSAATSSKAANNASNTNPSTGAAALAAVGVALAGAAVVATKKRK
ncbi:NPXTG-anchored protein [Ruminococcus sp.]|uniref:NPXTG-anchored protein n=1 Tax=Ruminococcus sp. TaxID=41978 RepID=UPI003AB71D48